MDGLVTNIALVAGVGGGGATGTIILTGMAGLVAGAFSMALGEFASVDTQNDAVAHEVRVERAEIDRHPEDEMAELADMYEHMGLTRATAEAVAREVHADPELAVKVHITQELGVDPDDQPSPWTAAISLVRGLLDRGDLPVGLVPARVVVAARGAADRRRRAVRGGAITSRFTDALVVARRAAAADVRCDRGGSDLPRRHGDRRIGGMTPEAHDRRPGSRTFAGIVSGARTTTPGPCRNQPGQPERRAVAEPLRDGAGHERPEDRADVRRHLEPGQHGAAPPLRTDDVGHRGAERRVQQPAAQPRDQRHRKEQRHGRDQAEHGRPGRGDRKPDQHRRTATALVGEATGGHQSDRVAGREHRQGDPAPRLGRPRASTTKSGTSATRPRHRPAVGERRSEGGPIGRMAQRGTQRQVRQRRAVDRDDTGPAAQQQARQGHRDDEHHRVDDERRAQPKVTSPPFVVYAVMLVVAMTLTGLLLRGRAGVVPVDGAALPDLSLRAALGHPDLSRRPRCGVRQRLGGVRGPRRARAALRRRGPRPPRVVGGIALSVFAAGNAITLVTAGRLADKRGRRPPMLVGLAVSASATAVLGLIPTMPLFLAVSLVAGLGSGLLNPPLSAAVADIVGAERRGGTVLAGFQMASDVGAILGPLVAGAVAQGFGYGAAFGLTGLVAALALALWLRAPETLPARVLEPGRRS